MPSTADVPPNGLEFCCRTGRLTNHSRYRTCHTASADSSNSLLECAPRWSAEDCFVTDHLSLSVYTR